MHLCWKPSKTFLGLSWTHYTIRNLWPWCEVAGFCFEADVFIYLADDNHKQRITAACSAFYKRFSWNTCSPRPPGRIHQCTSKCLALICCAGESQLGKWRNKGAWRNFESYTGIHQIVNAEILQSSAGTDYVSWPPYCLSHIDFLNHCGFNHVFCVFCGI